MVSHFRLHEIYLFPQRWSARKMMAMIFWPFPFGGSQSTLTNMLSVSRPLGKVCRTLLSLYDMMTLEAVVHLLGLPGLGFHRLSSVPLLGPRQLLRVPKVLSDLLFSFQTCKQENKNGILGVSLRVPPRPSQLRIQSAPALQVRFLGFFSSWSMGMLWIKIIDDLFLLPLLSWLLRKAWKCETRTS